MEELGPLQRKVLTLRGGLGSCDLMLLASAHPSSLHFALEALTCLCFSH